MANCKECYHFNFNGPVCTNPNVPEQHRLGNTSCSHFSGKSCGNCEYSFYGKLSFFGTTKLYCKKLSWDKPRDQEYQETFPDRPACFAWKKTFLDFLFQTVIWTKQSKKTDTECRFFVFYYDYFTITLTVCLPLPKEGTMLPSSFLPSTVISRV